MHAGPFDRFTAASPTHWLVLLATAAICAALISAARRASNRSPATAVRFDRAFGFALLLIWIIIVARNLLPGQLHWDHSLPLQICDIAALSAPLALLTRRRIWRNIVFYFGLGLCTQAFLWPQLRVGPAHLGFWLFWLLHIGIVSAALHQILARGYRPRWNDWQQMILAGAAYAAVALAVDIRLRVNYGYLGPAHFTQAAAILRFGPWPARVPRLMLATWLLMGLMTLPPMLAALWRNRARLAWNRPRIPAPSRRHAPTLLPNVTA